MKKPVAGLLLTCTLLAGCTTSTRIETSQLERVHDAYLDRNGTLLVCMTGTISGVTGKYSLHLPVNSTFLRPENSLKYFDPYYYNAGEEILPKFSVPISYIKRGCEVSPASDTLTPVPVVRDRYMPDPNIKSVAGMTRHSRNEYLAARKQAANAYIESLEQRVGKGATVYEAGYADGSHRAEFLFSSPVPIYGPYHTVSFSLPMRTVKKRKIVSPSAVVMLPATAVAGFGMGVAIMAQRRELETSSKRERSNTSGQQQPKKQEGKKKAKPEHDWSRIKVRLDNRLDGSWQSSDKIMRCAKHGRCFTIPGHVCFLQISGDQIVKQCSYHWGYLESESMRYTRVGKNTFRFKVTASGLEPKLVGATGKAEYRFDKRSMHIRSQFDDDDASILSEESTYSRR